MESTCTGNFIGTIFLNLNPTINSSGGVGFILGKQQIREINMEPFK